MAQYIVIGKRGTKEDRIPPDEVEGVISALTGTVPKGTRYTYQKGFFFESGDRQIWLTLDHHFLPVVEQALMKQFGETYVVDYS